MKELDRLLLRTKDLKGQTKEDKGLNGNIIIVKGLECTSKSDSDDQPRTLVFCMSTPLVDRENDSIDVNGWDVSFFNKAGPMLWGHDSRLPNIGVSRGAWVEGGKLLGRIEFTPKDFQHPLGEGFGHTVYRMYKEDFLKTVSVGFKAKEWAYNEERGDHAVDFKRQELLELSAVPVPANPEAMIEAGRKGINVQPIYDWVTRELDNNSNLIVSRETLEGVYFTMKDRSDLTGKTVKGEKIEINPDSSFKKVMSKLFGNKIQSEETIPMKDLEALTKKVDELTNCVTSLSKALIDSKETAAKEKKDAEDKAAKDSKAEEDIKKEMADMIGFVKDHFKQIEKDIEDKLFEHTGTLRD